jgi:hypothetical protein
MAGPGPAANLGPIWTRTDYYALSAVTALVVLVIGLVIGLTDTTSTTVQKNPAPTATSFTVASGDGKTLICGANAAIQVGGQEAHIAAIDGDQVTLAAPLSSVPASGATVSQSTLGPATVDTCAAVAASPAPTTTQFTLAGGAGVDFVAAGILVDGQQATVKSVDTTTYRISLSSPLASPPAAGTPVTQQLYTTGSLIGGIVGLAISEIAIVLLAVAPQEGPSAGRGGACLRCHGGGGRHPRLLPGGERARLHDRHRGGGGRARRRGLRLRAGPVRLPDHRALVPQASAATAGDPGTGRPVTAGEPR